MDDSLLTNPEVIAIDQHSYENRAVITTDAVSVWLATRGDLVLDRQPDRGHYLAVFNISDSPQTLHYEWKDLGLSEGSYQMRDLWERKNLGKQQSLTVKLMPHASVLYLVEGR